MLLQTKDTPSYSNFNFTRQQQMAAVKRRPTVPVKGRPLPRIKGLLQLPDLTGLSRLAKQAHLVQATLSDEVHTLLHHQRNHTHSITPFVQYGLLQALPKDPCKRRGFISKPTPPHAVENNDKTKHKGLAKHPRACVPVKGIQTPLLRLFSHSSP